MKKILGYLKATRNGRRRRGVFKESGEWMRFQFMRMGKMNQDLISMSGSK
jgi:hypothetical protein